MKTLNINITYAVSENIKTDNKYEYKLLIQYNEDNKSKFVFFGYEYFENYSTMLKFALNEVLKCLEKTEKDFETIQYNDFHFSHF